MNSDDPRRLFEDDEVPSALRGLLARAHDDALPDSILQKLVAKAECRAALPDHPPFIRRCASWAGRHVRRSGRFLVVLVMTGIGAGVWYGRVHHASDDVEKVARPMAPAQPALSAEDVLAHAPPAAGAGAEPEPPVPSATPSAGSARKQATLANRVRSAQVPPAAAPGTMPASPAQGEEFRLLRAARQALVPHPEQALKLTDEHVRRFANGMLVQEREAIAIDALTALGKGNQARVRSRAFLQSFPSSPYRGRVERALERAAAHP